MENHQRPKASQPALKGLDELIYGNEQKLKQKLSSIAANQTDTVVIVTPSIYQKKYNNVSGKKLTKMNEAASLD